MKTFQCDACQKYDHRCEEIEVPIVLKQYGKVTLMLKALDICPECRERLYNTMAREYYKIANENRSTGMQAIADDEGEDE